MTVLLGPSHIAMVAKGVSAIVASRDAALRPSIMRAVGSHISGDGQEVTVYLRRSLYSLTEHDAALLDRKLRKYAGHHHEHLDGYLERARQAPRRICVLDAARTPEAIRVDVERVVRERLLP